MRMIKNAMLTETEKTCKRNKKITAGGGAAVIRECADSRKDGLGLTGKKWAAGREPVRFKGPTGRFGGQYKLGVRPIFPHFYIPFLSLQPKLSLLSLKFPLLSLVHQLKNT